ncbi:helix-turn-helix transcriptional regulator [Dactylosporangium sp. CA-092794]|uniref:helix-turn-helix transcriptional regulator n=1 Tax=Dactylosporangium sp. CA-092794 TaxID=3239929 RepID=UPI003D8B29DB
MSVLTPDPIPFRKLLNTEELASLLDVDPSTIRRWRTAQPLQGPPFIQISERVTKYRTEDVDQWLDSRRVVPKAA